jgi:hypothetical protein
LGDDSTVPSSSSASGRSHQQAPEIDAVAGEDLRLAVERQMIAVLGDQHLGEHRLAR